MYCLAISAARAVDRDRQPVLRARPRGHRPVPRCREARRATCASWWPACRNDNVVARLNSVRLYGALLEAGVEMLEYNRTMLHHKTMVVDGLWATVGTTNFDNRSFAHNEENNVCVLRRRDCARAERDVQARDAVLCERVDLEAWRARPIARQGPAGASVDSCRIRSKRSRRRSSEKFLRLGKDRALVLPGLRVDRLRTRQVVVEVAGRHERAIRLAERRAGWRVEWCGREDSNLHPVARTSS